MKIKTKRRKASRAKKLKNLMKDRYRKMTKNEQRRQAKKHYEAWQLSEDYALEFAYGRYSENKACAWRHCRVKQKEMNGTGLKVITHNRMIFTAGFEYFDEITGVCMFYYISPTFECAIEITADML